MWWNNIQGKFYQNATVFIQTRLLEFYVWCHCDSDPESDEFSNAFIGTGVLPGCCAVSSRRHRYPYRHGWAHDCHTQGQRRPALGCRHHTTSLLWANQGWLHRVCATVVPWLVEFVYGHRRAGAARCVGLPQCCHQGKWLELYLCDWLKKPADQYRVNCKVDRTLWLMRQTDSKGCSCQGIFHKICTQFVAFCFAVVVLLFLMNFTCRYLSGLLDWPIKNKQTWMCFCNGMKWHLLLFCANYIYNSNGFHDL